MTKRTYLNLGRAGDVINFLPLLHEYHGSPTIISKEFAPILEGVSYTHGIEFDGTHRELHGATAWARSVGIDAVNVQCHGDNYTHGERTESFMRDMWHMAGYDHRWEQRELVFDRRDFMREAALVNRFAWDKPVILYCADGISSPFPHKHWLKAILQSEFGRSHTLIDLASPECRCERVYDLLALYDRAEILISIDTMHLHLSQASSVPVVAYVNPVPWVGSLRRANFRLYERYSAITADPVGAAKRLIECVGKPHFKGRIGHAWAEYKAIGSDLRRIPLAQRTWPADWRQIPIAYRQDSAVIRSNAIDPEGYDVPQFVSMADRAFAVGENIDALVFTNSDVGLVKGVDARIRHLLARAPAIFGYRWDRQSITQPLTYAETVSSWGLCGLDLFAFTRDWWKRNRAKIPPFWIGRTNWDLVMRDIIKSTGGCPLYGYVWHELHNSDWKVKPTLPSNEQNLLLSREWWKTHDTTRPFPVAWEQKI